LTAAAVHIMQKRTGEVEQVGRTQTAVLISG
jgi:hypothetical protein